MTRDDSPGPRPGRPLPDARPGDTGAHRGSGTAPDGGSAYEMSPRMRAAARAAYAMRVDPAVVAGVSADSVETPATGIRAAALLDEAPRYVTFHAEGVTIDLEITPRAERCDVVGRVAPPGPTTVQVRHLRATTGHTVDAYGTFIARDVPRGPISLVLHRPEDPPVATDWLSV
ncbi:hypothetical protein ACFPZ0_11470 [Streptomonospora nanhaiensis]|uniref:Uncharacterized protein n=1 Tax=Streptomonospora nanhaiensis TaxID=1323731 RepID=A0A853BVA9_9ACTN|nr:hypothetical protein [Streptomonospora nanhaiensis]MBX9390313.1 hypothetical protein [Streptomonospora nanhaiensis]NYI98685.1 hypothetical protein [Streptomonospora nanhaiensis]